MPRLILVPDPEDVALEKGFGGDDKGFFAAPPHASDKQAGPGPTVFADGILQETFRYSFAGRALGWWYPFWQGTSMASPHVAGVAALIIAVNPGYTASDVRDAIVNTAKDLDVPGWDEVYGYGLLDAAAALEY